MCTDEHPDLNDTCYDKVALLIGNKKYHQGQLMLNTPENDTQDLAGVLRSAGFKVVSLVNLTKQEMDKVCEPMSDGPLRYSDVLVSEMDKLWQCNYTNKTYPGTVHFVSPPKDAVSGGNAFQNIPTHCLG